MKKLLFFAFSALLLCACRGPQGPIGPQGPQGPAGEGTNWKIVDITVAANQWSYSNFTDNNYFFSKWDVADLTSFVFTDGNVQGYIYMTENGERIQHALPYVLHVSTTDTDGNPYYFSRTIDFVYGTGWVQFEYRESDFDYEYNTSFVPDAMDFRIVMTY